MRSIRTNLAAAAVAAAMIISPIAASAATMSTAAAQPPSNAWVTLSQLTPAGASALAGSSVVASATVAASAAAVEPVDESAEPSVNPFPIPVVVVLLAVLGTAIYIGLIEKHHGHASFPGTPVSPN
jgi:hypothetical protein